MSEHGNRTISSTFGGRASGYYGIAHISAVLADQYGLEVTANGKVIFRNEYGKPIVDSNQEVSKGVRGNLSTTMLPKKPAYFADLVDPESSTLINNAYVVQEQLDAYRAKNPTTTGYKLSNTFTVSSTGPTDQPFRIAPSQDIG